MILAGDVGGTNTRLGLFDQSTDRPRQIDVAVFPTLEFRDLEGIVSAFAGDRRMPLDAAAFGVAGPVIGDSATLTNVPWRVEGNRIAKTFDIPHVGLLNDLQAMAYAVPALAPSELRVLQEGTPDHAANLALIAAGTGLGEAILHYVGGRHVPVASEGGHADFPARNEREIDLVRELLRRYGHAEVEHVVSGAGLVNLHRVTHVARPCLALDDLNLPDAPAVISAAGLERRCIGCIEALNMFVEAYGAEAGHRPVGAGGRGGGVVGGGIAPKILPALMDGRFARAFADKAAPFHEMLAAIPVKVILNDEAGLVGAAIYAASLITRAGATRR
jgi:glucokinase